MNQSETDLGIVNESQLLRFGIIVHGMFAKDFLLPWEDRDEFVALHDGLVREYFPNGISEEETVLHIAQLFWKKRRLSKLHTTTVLRDSGTQAILETGETSWHDINRALRKQARKDRDVITAMSAAFTEAFGQLTRLGKRVRQELGTEKPAALGELVKEGISIMNEKILPGVRKIHKIPGVDDALDLHFKSEDLEKVARLEAMIDAQIAKAMSRLVGIKEFKKTPAGSPLRQLIAPKPQG
jgi:hypothetical protein